MRLLQLLLQQSPGPGNLGLSLLGSAVERSPGGVWAGCCGYRVLLRIFAVVLGELLSFQREHITSFLNLTHDHKKDGNIYMCISVS